VSIDFDTKKLAFILFRHALRFVFLAFLFPGALDMEIEEAWMNEMNVQLVNRILCLLGTELFAFGMHQKFFWILS
jgi:hypothetical protein